MAKVEWLILADGAQVVGNKLYVMGGGWDTLYVNSGFPAQHRLAVAAAFRVPWNETNQRQNAEIEIADEDGKSLAKIQGQFEVGRPPGIKLGQDQRFQFAADLAMSFDGPGSHVVIARLEGQEEARVSFNVVPGPGLTTRQQPERGKGA